MSFFFIFILSNVLLAAPTYPWVGIYKHVNNADSLSIDQCTEKDCKISIYISQTPAHLLFDCPASFKFQVGKNKLSLFYKDINDEKNSTHFSHVKENKYRINEMNLLPAVSDGSKKVCAFEPGVYFKQFDSEENSKLSEKLSVCRNVNDKIWVPLCFDSSIRELVLAYLQKSTEEKLIASYKKEFDHQFSTRTEWEDLFSFILDLYYQQISGDRPAAKVLKEQKFQGIYETQRLSFGDGLSNWSMSLNFENCKKEKCDYIFEQCDGLNFSSHDCQETRGQAIFENETTIVMKELCDKEKALLQKKEGHWEVNPAGCSHLPRAADNPKPAKEIKQIFYEAGFNCLNKKLSDVESLICHSASLSQTDKWLAELYSEMKTQKIEVKDQPTWLKSRKACFKKEAHSCLNQMYKKRIVDWYLQLKI